MLVLNWTLSVKLKRWLPRVNVWEALENFYPSMMKFFYAYPIPPNPVPQILIFLRLPNSTILSLRRFNSSAWLTEATAMAASMKAQTSTLSRMDRKSSESITKTKKQNQPNQCRAGVRTRIHRRNKKKTNIYSLFSVFFWKTLEWGKLTRTEGKE